MKKLKRLKCRLQEFRFDAGITQAEAAKRAGVSVSYWADCERVEKCPSAGYAELMASAVGKTTVEVWPNIRQVWHKRGGFR
jgi:DNA-binding XRE family transcriptional regulator